MAAAEFSFPQGKIPSALTPVQRLTESKTKTATKRKPVKPKKAVLYDDDSENDDPSSSPEDDNKEEQVRRSPPRSNITKKNAEISDELHRLIVQRLRDSPLMSSRPSRANDGSFFTLTFEERVNFIELRFGATLQAMFVQLECVRCLRKYREIDNMGHWECTYHCGGGHVDYDTNAVIWSCCKRRAAGNESDGRRGCTRCDHTVNHIINPSVVPTSTQVDSLLLPILRPLQDAVLTNSVIGKHPDSVIRILRAEDSSLNAQIDGRFANRQTPVAPRPVFRPARNLLEAVVGSNDNEDYVTKKFN